MTAGVLGPATGAWRLASAWVAGAFVFILLYNPTIAVLDASLLRGIVAFGVAAMVVAGSWYSWPRRAFTETLLLIGAFVVAFGAAQALAFRGGGDTFFLSLILSCLTGYMPAALVVASCCGFGRPATPTFIGLIAVVAAIQAVLIALDWISPAAHALFARIVVQPDLSHTVIRSSGLSSAAGDGLSFLQCLGAMCATVMSATAHAKVRQIAWALIAALCLASIVLAGRTGFVLFAVFVLVMGLRASMIGGLLRTASIVAVAIVAIAGVTLLALPAETMAMLVDRVLPHAFEFIGRYLAGEGLGTSSTDDLRAMFFLPSDQETLLLGSGHFADPLVAMSNFMGTDIGYVRTVFYVGIVGSLLVYAWYGLLWVMMRRVAPAGGLTAFVDALFVVFLVAHVKFPFLYLGAGIGFGFALFFCLHLDRRRCTSAA